MGHIIKKNNPSEYQQDDGRVTAWFSHHNEKMILVHEGNPYYKKIFYLLVSLGLAYLTLVFLFVR